MNYLKLKEENQQLTEKLKGDWKSKAFDIKYYLKTKLRLKFRTEIVMNDILNMFLDYQERDEKVSDLVGDDIKEFCDNIIESQRVFL